MSIFVAVVKTDSGDQYVWAYKVRPNRKDVVKRVHQYEQAESLKWYMETTDVEIHELEVE